MNKFLKITLFFILIYLLSSGAYAQYKPGKERGDPKYRAKGQMEGNQIRTTIQNFGLSGRTGGVPPSEQTPYEWPKNTGKYYLAMEGLWAGGEVKAENDSTIKMIDVFSFRTSPQGKSWNIEPIPGYYSSKRQEVATSSDQDTWPASWPDKQTDTKDPGWAGKWNGFFGKDVKNADQEMFYKASDDKYNKYNYIPDTTDRSRGGLGLTFEVRAMAWSQVLVEDVLYLIHTIKNDGTKDIKKVAVTIWYADFVGGNSGAATNISEFDILRAFGWSHFSLATNKTTDFGNDPVGAIACAFLETPGNAVNRIDDDGDGESNGPKVTAEMIVGEDPENVIDDNGNGLIDENQTHIPFGTQVGTTYADGIDNNDQGMGAGGIGTGPTPTDAPKVTQEMVNQAAGDKWKRWPPNPENDPIQKGKVNLIMVEANDIDHAFRDNIDHGDHGEPNSPVVTQAMIDQAASDPYKRWVVPGTGVILYNVVQNTLGHKYADGKDNNPLIVNGDTVYQSVDEGINDYIDEMIDESRVNGIDDDHDWNPITDDVGLDGVANTGDVGEGDGKPTSGAYTSFPGEPNIDLTDVHETDRIGITNAQYVASNEVNVQTTSDVELWFRFMRPGKFYDPATIRSGDYDLFISSSFFPINSGSVEPISLAIILANGPFNDPNWDTRRNEVIKKRTRAQETYNNDYRFANAPLPPTLTAIPGDNRVTLHWDDIAETSYDKYLEKIGADPHSFEGYRIYRSSDPAFTDPLLITNGNGTLQFKLPMKQYDLVDGVKGWDSTGIDGVHFWLGDDSGLLHSFIDTTVKNGFTYYYAITSYSKGVPTFNILPSECPIRISVQSDGSVKYGSNVAKVIPEAPAGGYVPANLVNLTLVQGSTTGVVSYDIVDINKIKDGHVYFLTFEDTLKKGNMALHRPDTLTTKNYTLTDSTTNETLINKNTNLAAASEQPLIDGFRLKFTNESRVELDRSRSHWIKNPADTMAIKDYVFEKYNESNGKLGTERPSDYMIMFSDNMIDTSVTVNYEDTDFPSKPVNFRVYNLSEKRFIKFGFVEMDTQNGEGKLTSNIEYPDRIFFLEKNAKDSLINTWSFYLATDSSRLTRFPGMGDTIKIMLRKPFLSADKFRFVAKSNSIDPEKAKKDLENIKVVPNPYVATALWEAKNPYASGRGPRSIHFTHLPPKCTIRIFTVSGELVSTLEHNAPNNDGTEYWDLLTKDKLAVSYGVYVFHVDAPGIGEKIGKFAIIK